MRRPWHLSKATPLLANLHTFPFDLVKFICVGVLQLCRFVAVQFTPKALTLLENRTTSFVLPRQDGFVNSGGPPPATP
jgi:hypothetical protein